MTRSTLCTLHLLLVPCLLAAQSPRDRTRPAVSKETAVTDNQATDLTLTLSQASMRPIQTWVRTAGSIGKNAKVLTAYLFPPDAGLVKVGQRVRAFPPDSKSSVYQAWITRVVNQGERVMAEATLAGTGRANSPTYVMEIIVDQGRFLSVPNEAIIEEGARRIVYVQPQPGRYVPQEIHTGLQGELYTQVLHGLNEGDQAVTFGSFFIDSEHKLKNTGQNAPANDHQHHH